MITKKQTILATDGAKLPHRLTMMGKIRKKAICVYRCSSVAITILWLGLSVVPASAQVLTSGADFLKIDSGARSQGMGGAFTAVADSVNALTWNPAGVALLKNPEVGYLRMLYFADIAYNFGGIAVPLQAGEDTLGLGAGVVNLGSSFDSTLGVAPAISTGDNAFLLSIAYRIKNIAAFGVTGKYIMRNIAGYNAAAFGGDVGFLVTPGDVVRIGVGIFNVGQPVQFVSASDPLPMTGRLGLGFQIINDPHNSFMLSIDNSYQIDAQAYQAAAGGEYWLDKTLALRAGYTGDAYQQHWTAGIGLNVKVFQLDYAYAPAGTLGDTHRISATLRFGTEEAISLLAPTGFAAKAMDQSAGLSWKPSSSPDVVGYNLYVKKPGTASFVHLTRSPINDTSIKLKHLQNGLNYTFAVASVSGAGRESSMTQMSVVPAGEPVVTAPILQAPTGLKADAAGTSLSISWDKAAMPDVAGFNLYLADEKGKQGQKLTAKAITENKVVLKKLNPDKVYRFVVTTVSKAGMESVPTGVLEAKLSDLQKAQLASLLPPSPSHLVVEAGDSLANLHWDVVKDAVGYHIYTSDDGKTFRQLTKGGPKLIQKVVLKPLKNGKTYYFGVSSVTADGKESDKAIQTVIPTAK